eukprot:TRINITY_DN6500_c0_g1_i1.p2 TRINITY_DN6500_c0_g1~~TRINITY_DN6500_c0_g1_i1.p2  ORF type:complete len:105 (+),score=28.24 TRINITY_DN6500_c0_g1_i1:788-1102(+)
MQVWKESLKDDFKNDISWLEGLAVVEQSIDGSKKISWYPISNLPTEIPSRIDALFTKMRRWKLNEITPYLTDLVPSNSSLDQILLQHTTQKSQDSTTYYTKKTT